MKVAHSAADAGACGYTEAHWHGQGLDLKIQAVDDDGSRTSMDVTSSCDGASRSDTDKNCLLFLFSSFQQRWFSKGGGGTTNRGPS